MVNSYVWPVVPYQADGTFPESSAGPHCSGPMNQRELEAVRVARGPGILLQPPDPSQAGGSQAGCGEDTAGLCWALGGGKVPSLSPRGVYSGTCCQERGRHPRSGNCRGLCPRTGRSHFERGHLSAGGPGVPWGCGTGEASLSPNIPGPAGAPHLQEASRLQEGPRLGAFAGGRAATSAENGWMDVAGGGPSRAASHSPAPSLCEGGARPTALLGDKGERTTPPRAGGAWSPPPPPRAGVPPGGLVDAAPSQRATTVPQPSQDSRPPFPLPLSPGCRITAPRARGLIKNKAEP